MIFSVEKITLLVDENNPPYSYIENNEMNGLYIDIIKKLDEKILEFDILFKPIPWIRGLKMLETGEAYGIVSPWYRPVDRPYLYYSDSFFREEKVIVTILENNSNLIWPNDFKNKKIGINRGYSVINNEDKKSLKIEEANETNENLLKLFSKRIDFYINDKNAILWELNRMINSKILSNEDGKKLKITKILGEEDGYMGYSKNYKNRSIKFENEINKEIKNLKNGKELELILSQYNLTK